MTFRPKCDLVLLAVTVKLEPFIEALASWAMLISWLIQLFVSSKLCIEKSANTRGPSDKKRVRDGGGSVPGPPLPSLPKRGLT